MIFLGCLVNFQVFFHYFKTDFQVVLYLYLQTSFEQKINYFNYTQMNKLSFPAYLSNLVGSVLFHPQDKKQIVEYLKPTTNRYRI